MNFKYLLILGFCFLLPYKSIQAQIYLKDVSSSFNEINRYDNGKQGVWFFFERSDSVVHSMKYYSNDTLNGDFILYWRNGKISDKGQYLKGELQGKHYGYWENGQLRYEVNYLNGALNGLSVTFDSNGNLTSREYYIQGAMDINYKDRYYAPNFEPDESLD
ncbi:MAG: hypothetical protein R2766_13830 [Saprospiraceae bacterium]